MKCHKCDGTGRIKMRNTSWYHYYKVGLTGISCSSETNPNDTVFCDVCAGTGELVSYEDWMR